MGLLESDVVMAVAMWQAINWQRQTREATRARVQALKWWWSGLQEFTTLPAEPFLTSTFLRLASRAHSIRPQSKPGVVCEYRIWITC